MKSYRDLDEYSVLEINSILESLRAKYDIVQLVDVEECRVLEVQPDGAIRYGRECFCVWDRHMRCANCSGYKACMTHSAADKTEHCSGERQEARSTPIYLEMLNGELAPKGLQAQSLFSLVMPESYVCMPYMYADTPELEKQKIDKATEHLEHYATMIAERRRGEVHTVRGVTPWTFSHVIGAYFNARMISDKKFTVDHDLCIHCGRCAKLCPVNALT